MLRYSNIAIWCFSGTGNALFASNQISSTAKEMGVEVNINHVTKASSNIPAVDAGSLIGFCYPTHGFNAPPVMLKFFARFPKGTNKVFFLNTRAGMKLSKIHTPGLGGIALWLPMLIMIFKGYKPVGFRPIDMPSNWISLHPGLRAKVVQSIKERCTQTLERFTKKILNGKPVLNGLLWLPLDIAVVPISVLYYFLGRFAIAKTFYANYSCNSCRLCINQCPVGAIVEKSGRPYWTFRCESCMKCMNSCPKRAIETAHGYSFLIWWAAFSFFPSLLFRLLFEAKVITPEVYNQYHFLLHYGSMILAGFIVIFFGYKILHQLLRMKLLNRIITYTSLTHYKFWRRYFLH